MTAPVTTTERGAMTAMEDAILDIDALSRTLRMIGLLDEDAVIDPKAIHWLGCQLADLRERLDRQLELLGATMEAMNRGRSGAG